MIKSEKSTVVAAVKQQFDELRLQVEKLNYSEDSIIELGAIKLRAESIAKSIDDAKYRNFCLVEISQVNTDEFDSMFKHPSENTFGAARFEFMQILKDCRSGRLNSF